jgi:hypothetical protein
MPEQRLKNGTLVTYTSMGSRYHGFIIGTCSYDGAESDNAYVVRYVWPPDGEQPRRPFAIVKLGAVELVKKFSEDFSVGGHWSRTPDDRCDEWTLEKDGETGNLVIKPIGKTG